MVSSCWYIGNIDVVFLLTRCRSDSACIRTGPFQKNELCQDGLKDTFDMKNLHDPSGSGTVGALRKDILSSELRRLLLKPLIPLKQSTLVSDVSREPKGVSD